MKYLWLIALFVFPSLVFSQYNISKFIEAGKNALEYKDYTSAIKYFNNVIDNRPKIHEAYYFRGKAKYYLGDFSGSEADLTEVLNLNPYYYDAYELRGSCRMHLHKYKEAANDYSRSTTYKTDDINIWYNWVYCLLESGDYELADNITNQMLSKWHESPRVLFLKSLCLYSLNQTQALDAILDYCLSLDPFNIDALNFKAHNLFSHGKWQESEQYFTRFLHLYPSNSDKLVYRGLCLLAQGKISESLKDLNTALSISPKNIIGLYNRALLYYSTDKTKYSIEDLKTIIAQSEYSDVASRILNSIVNYKREVIIKPELSFNNLRKLSDSTFENTYKYVIYDDKYIFSNIISPNTFSSKELDFSQMYSLLPPLNLTSYQFEAYNNPQSFIKGYESLLMKDYLMAIKYFTQCNNENNYISESYYNRSYAYAQINNFEKSLSDLNNAIRYNNNFAEAYYNRGLLYLRLKNTEAARKDFSKAGELGIDFAYRIIKEIPL